MVKTAIFLRSYKTQASFEVSEDTLKYVLVTTGHQTRSLGLALCSRCMALTECRFSTWSHKSKSWGVRYGERAGLEIGRPRLIHLFQAFISKYCLVVLTPCLNVSICWKFSTEINGEDVEAQNIETFFCATSLKQIHYWKSNAFPIIFRYGAPDHYQRSTVRGLLGCL